MHDDPQRPDPADPGDETQRHDTPFPETAASTPAPTPPVEPAAPLQPSPWAAPATPVTPASPAGGSYSPSSETRPDWIRTYDETAPGTPERWYEPTPATVPLSPAVTQKRTGTGSVVAAALLAAVLASGGTVAALGAVGALDRATPAAASAPGTNVGAAKPVTIDESSATIAVAAKVSPAVVRITVTGSTNSPDLGVIPESGVGSGVIYDSNGWILTNKHVVEGGDTFDVELNDGRVLSGSVYGIDTLTDLAIVKVSATDLPSAALGESDALKVGQLVVAIGSPLGTYSNSVTSGIVSATGRTITTDGSDRPLNNLIQTDAAINPGNSGGPLLDADGNVIGINTAIASGSNGIGFAIPIDIARPIMDQAVAGEKLARPYMGISFVTISRQYAEEESLPVQQGALVGGTDSNGQATNGVVAGTPAADAGIQNGDILVKVGDKTLDAEHPLDATLSQYSPGDVVAVELLRDGQTLTVNVTLGTRPADL
jgi:S1-C subfamily serine protease